ncbi:hypothetical protein B0A48_05199 [Cryoendolithus antarcticus]|uniref:Uncharacterized protein n=1 Tax=Cryoendolithus antarcticus TaxID=1507870 RepID=A0A1V8TI30_9PEZI|nr:hypothetical protein B0A48_05199 [Cryoendolithus antarcticus]
MAINIRKRLSKRSTSRSPRKKPLPPSPKNMPPPVPDKHDLTDAPPPPQQLVMPQQPEAVRTSPSKSLLERYKNRSPISRIPSLVTPPKTSPSPPGKATAFTEEFGEVNRTISLDDAISPTADVPNTSNPSLTIDGVQFDMISGSGGVDRRSRSAEPPSQRTSSIDSGEDTTSDCRRRATRSQTRRQERIDSYASSVESGITNTEKKKPGEAERNPSAYPRPLAITKVNAAIDVGELKRKKSEDELAAPEPMVRAHSTMVLRPKSKGATFTVGNDKPKKDNADDDDDDSDPDGDSSSSSLSLPGDASQALTALPSPSSLITPLKVTRATVRLFPPIHNSEQPPALQWISTLSASSRPHVPWQWCKRWTCCKCEGHTIVEQEY